MPCPGETSALCSYTCVDGVRFVLRFSCWTVGRGRGVRRCLLYYLDVIGLTDYSYFWKIFFKRSDWNNNLTGMFSAWGGSVARSTCKEILLPCFLADKYICCLFCVCYRFVQLCDSARFTPPLPTTHLKARGTSFFYNR